QVAEEQATNQGAEDADDDIANHTKATTAHEQAGQPASHQSHQDQPEYFHYALLRELADCLLVCAQASKSASSSACSSSMARIPSSMARVVGSRSPKKVIISR